jgi:hypothetical protein
MSTLALPTDRSAAGAARLMGDSVWFEVQSATGRFECRVTTEVLASFEVAANDDCDWVATYLRHHERIDDVARTLIAHGLRGPHLAVCAHHFMD